MQRASSDIARRMRELSETLSSERDERESAFAAARGASSTLAGQMDGLAESLRRMQEAVDTLTGELDMQQNGPAR